MLGIAGCSEWWRRVVCPLDSRVWQLHVLGRLSVLLANIEIGGGVSMLMLRWTSWSLMVGKTDGRNDYPLDDATVDDSILHRDGDGGGPRLGGAGAADSAPKSSFCLAEKF